MNIMQQLRQAIHPPSKQEQKEIIDEITESASPGFDFFLLVVLSCSIATMGLITNSLPSLLARCSLLR